MKIPSSSLIHVLRGVATATKSSDEETRPISDWISAVSPAADGDGSDEVRGLTFAEWQAAVSDLPLSDKNSLRLAKVTLAVAFLRESCREDEPVAEDSLAQSWSLIYSAIITPSLERALFTASRSAQGFISIPLCSILSNGKIDELFRLHVWVPDGVLGNPDFAIHSHQPFAQSWVLAGEVEDGRYHVQATTDSQLATHAGYAIAWDDGKSQNNVYKTHQASSIVKNTGKLFQVAQTTSMTYTDNATYSIPAAAFHTTKVAPEAVHATLFFFDSHRGFVQDAGVLGPRDGVSFTQPRAPGTATPAALANAVEAVRSWKTCMQKGQQHAARTEWEDALQSFDSALSICKFDESLPSITHYRFVTLGQLASTNRRFGRYEVSTQILETTISEMPLNLLRIELLGELGVAYRHMNRLEDAKLAFENQYGTAKELGLDREMCRAVGNLGMVNYQLSQTTHDNVLLELALEQLTERVESARRIKETLKTQGSSGENARWFKTLTTWESIGISRLALCHYARGNVKQTIDLSLEALQITSAFEDVTVKAISRFFYGRALLLENRKKEALSLFNLPGTCTPAIAFAKEPSVEHRGYLRELVEVGADMDIIDEQGYTALDHAVFNGDVETEAILLDGLLKNARDRIERRQIEARLRKGYRELLQENLRPVLLAGGAGVLRNLRTAYANALAADETKKNMFDGLKFIPYWDFLEFNRLPRSSDGLVQEFVPDTGSGQENAEVVVFISYRWINKEPGAKSPDDSNNTQYKRMMSAIEEFLVANPAIDRNKLGIWMDHACVNQDDPSKGVSALPIIVSQCDAVISLIDDEYYDRGWCAVEALMVQTLRQSYGLHLWYEHVFRDDLQRWGLAKAAERKIVMGDKRLTFEEDRPKVLFLERQSRLLGL